MDDALSRKRSFGKRSTKIPFPTTTVASGKGNTGTNPDEQELFVRFAVSQSSPMLFQSTPAFYNFMCASNPTFPKMFGAGLRKAAMGYFAKERVSLLHVLRDLNSRVCLTCSVWSDPFCEVIDGLVYLYLNCHWIDENWEKQNRVLGFLKLEFPMDSGYVSCLISEAISKWGIDEGKVLSVSLGNDVSDDAAAVVSELQDSLSPMLLDGQVFHGKCAYRVVDLCLEHGFSMISGILEKVRYVVQIIELRGPEQVKDLCKHRGVKYRRIFLNVPLSNRTTYEMLDAFVEYRAVVTELCSLRLAAGEYRGTPLMEDEWSVVCRLRDFMERFSAGFDMLCSVYVPTSNLVIPMLYTLSKGFAQYRDDKHVGRICAGMEAKFTDYWDDGVPMVYCLATILDPRYKLDGLFKLLDGYHGNMNLSVGDMKSEIQTLFYRMYDAYFQQHCPPSIRKRYMVRAEGCGSGTKTVVRRVHRTRKDDDGKASREGKVSYTELNYYLSSNDVLGFGEEDVDRLDMFDVLKWWKLSRAKYPVLATLARDLLAPLASTKVPEGTFDFHDSVVNEKRGKISPKAAEMSVCLKDWLQAESREQHLLVDDRYREPSSDEEEEGDDDEDDNSDDDDDDFYAEIAAMMRMVARIITVMMSTYVCWMDWLQAGSREQHLLVLDRYTEQSSDEDEDEEGEGEEEGWEDDHRDDDEEEHSDAAN